MSADIIFVCTFVLVLLYAVYVLVGNITDRNL